MELKRFERAEVTVSWAEQKVEKLKRELDLAEDELNAAYAERSAANVEKMKLSERGHYQHGQRQE